MAPSTTGLCRCRSTWPRGTSSGCEARPSRSGYWRPPTPTSATPLSTATGTGRVAQDEHPTGGGEGFISLIRPSGVPTGNGQGGSDADAWDPADPDTPRDAMEGIAWLDGTPSNLACAPSPAPTGVMRVYFDMRGAGDNGAPVAGVEVTFELTGPGGNQLAAATTRPDGVAQLVSDAEGSSAQLGSCG